MDAALLARMADALAARGPDALAWREVGGCGLVHALLATGDGPPPPQPFSLDGERWIVADARIDGRGDLVRALRDAGEDAPGDGSAAELILRSYRAWGDGCVARLLGDFAFAVWDAPRRRLFCARDHFGVRLLYHAAPRGAFVFSNTLESVLRHPGVGRELDEVAVADFLVLAMQHDPGRTIRREVRALPPAHALVVEDGRVRTWRYWSLPVEEPVRFRRVEDYADRFVELLSRAVSDRLPRGPAGIFMSGGRDSTAVAALARGVAPGAGVRAFTTVYERFFHDREREYAALAANALEIPVTWRAADDYRVFERAGDDPRLRRPQPADSTLLALEMDGLADAGAYARVALTGFGGDAVLRETRSRLTRLALRGRLLRAALEGAQYAWFHRRVPRPGVRTWLATRGTRQSAPVDVPPWIAVDFAARLGLADRIHALNTPPGVPHPTRPEAYEQLASPVWPHLFAHLDAGVTGIPVEERHPFFDVRLVRFVLSVPPAQWYNDKGLLRIGMRGRLPGAILRRPKAPLPVDPLAVRRAAAGDGWLRGLRLGPEAGAYVDAGRVPRATGGTAETAPGELWIDLRPLSLSLWLRSGGAG